ncbi:MAG TPA: cytochrome c3 family protein [Gemmatimonadales bacterium]|nr:cytochrome c3 family protein [Gemmatimonadales bacterium]
MAHFRLASALRLLGVLPALVFLASACSSEKIVFRDPRTAKTPADTAGGYLGYFDVANKQTTCGGCHVAHQRDWKGTPHAGAYKTLTDLGSEAQPFCFNCHTVNGRGNKSDSTAKVGWNQVQDSSYHDVQCESCHGPGFQHVQSPDTPGNVPLAHVSMDDSSASCAACHSGTHHPFVNEWKQSGHSGIIAEAAGRTECQSCHNGLGTLKSWGVNTAFAEQGRTTPMAVTCAVCHNPHGSPNESQLRFSISSPDPEQNLCMRCHLRRAEPAGGAYGLGPHAPQGAVLLGTAGYRARNFAYDTARIFTSHASERNPRLCAGCHVQNYEVTDSLTGTFQFRATGHLFKADPCVDPATRKPLADNSCAYTTDVRSFRACANSGCHASEQAAASALVNERDRINTLANQIWADNNANDKVDAGDTGYLAQIMTSTPTAFQADTVISPAEGALFNIRLVVEKRYANGDRSLGVHNPFLAEALLRANVTELQQVYGLGAPSAAVQRILESPLPEQSLQRPPRRILPGLQTSLHGAPARAAGARDVSLR